MRTTVDIPDKTYRKLRIKAAEQERTIKELILEGVEDVLTRSVKPEPMKKLKLPLIKKKPGNTHVITKEMVDEALLLS